MSEPPLRTPSLRRRTTLVVLLLLAVVLVVLVVVTDVAVRSRLDGQLRERLLDRTGTAEALLGQVDERDLARRLEGQGVSVVLTTTDGTTYAEGPLAGRAPADEAPSGSDDAPRPPSPPSGPEGAPLPPGPAGPAGAEPQVEETGDLLSVAVTLGDGTELVLLADAADVRATVAQVRLALLVTALLVLLVAAALVPLVVGRALRPLTRITAVAHRIADGERDRRLRPVDPGTDLGRTAAAFDVMLDDVVGAEQRARTSEARLRDFVSDAAHELRSPVTAVQAAAENLLRDDPPRAERERTLVSLIRETRRAGRFVDDLLLMARIDQGLGLASVPVALHALAVDVVETRRAVHPDARLTVTGDAPTVSGDRDRLAQVLGNLLDNAVAAAGATAAVDVVVGTDDPEGGTAWVEVRDDGPGVPAADRERVFDRLVRLDPSRTGGGSGLGLSIARGIARAHGGDLRCLPPRAGDPDRPGAVFRLTLPRARTT